MLWPAARYLERLFVVMQQADAWENLVLKVQIVALCRERGVLTVLTNDWDFERFKDATVGYV